MHSDRNRCFHQWTVQHNVSNSVGKCKMRTGFTCKISSRVLRIRLFTIDVRQGERRRPAKRKGLYNKLKSDRPSNQTKTNTPAKSHTNTAPRTPAAAVQSLIARHSTFRRPDLYSTHLSNLKQHSCESRKHTKTHLDRAETRHISQFLPKNPCMEKLTLMPSFTARPMNAHRDPTPLPCRSDKNM